MNKQDILDLVGQDAYNKQGEMLWRAAPYTGARKVPVGYDTVLAGDISDFIRHEEHQDLNDVDRVKLTLGIYRDMPCYTLLFEIAIRYNGGSLFQPACDEVVQHVQSLLADDEEALAQPIAYMLAVDILGDDHVQRWAEMLTTCGILACYESIFCRPTPAGACCS